MAAALGFGALAAAAVIAKVKRTVRPPLSSPPSPPSSSSLSPAKKARRLAHAIASDIALHHGAACEQARRGGGCTPALLAAVDEGRALYGARVEPALHRFYDEAIDAIVRGGNVLGGNVLGGNTRGAAVEPAPDAPKTLIHSDQQARDLAQAIASDILLYNLDACDEARRGVQTAALTHEIDEGRSLFRARVMPSLYGLYDDAIHDIVLGGRNA